jgi:hypothetical protein
VVEADLDYAVLVDFTRRNPRHDNRICQEAFVLAMSNAIRNRANFAGDRDWTYFTARDMICFRSMLEWGHHMSQVTYARAILDDDREAIDVLNRAGMPEKNRTWVESLWLCPKEEAARHLGALERSGDEDALWLTRVVLSRRFPDLLDAAWLRLCPERLPQAAARIANLLIANKPDAIGAVREFLLEKQHVLMLADPEPTLVALAINSASPPEQSLKGFEPYHGEALNNAAAQWFLQHGHPRGAVMVTEKIRPFSKHADRAHQLRGLALIDLDQVDQAAVELEFIFDRPMANALRLALAEKNPQFADNAKLMEIAHACDAHQAELFYKAIVALLGRKCLAEARDLCRAKKTLFANHPTLTEIIKKIG